MIITEVVIIIIIIIIHMSYALAKRGLIHLREALWEVKQVMAIKLK